MDSPSTYSHPDERFAPVSAGVELCYQTFGDPDREPLLLVMGLAGPMTWWDEEFCELLVDAGFFVIRYDNRDIGRSSRARGRVTRTQLAAAFLGRPVAAPYTIRDLATDGVGLLDHLGIDRAHLVGVSMGGMIAQSLAIDHPHRVLSVTSIMSTTGSRRVGWQDPRLLPRLLARRQTERAAYVETSATFWKYIGSPDFPMDPDRLRTKAGLTWDRGISTSGIMRQMLAVVTQPDRTAELGRLDIPFLVIHGTADRMVHSSGGRATARAIPGAVHLEIKGMGHDLPPQLWPRIVRAIRSIADRARSDSR